MATRTFLIAIMLPSFLGPEKQGALPVEHGTCHKDSKVTTRPWGTSRGRAGPGNRQLREGELSAQREKSPNLPWSAASSTAGLHSKSLASRRSFEDTRVCQLQRRACGETRVTEREAELNTWLRRGLHPAATMCWPSVTRGRSCPPFTRACVRQRSGAHPRRETFRLTGSSPLPLFPTRRRNPPTAVGSSFDRSTAGEHATRVVVFSRRLSSVALTLALLAGNIGVCAAWAATPEARMACCAEGHRVSDAQVGRARLPQSTRGVTGGSR